MLKNKNAFITGGNKGIGKAISLKFAEKGANIYFTYNSNPIHAEETKKEILKFGVDCNFFQLNLSDKQNTNEVINKILQSINNIHILVNNAGFVSDSLFLKSNLEEWWKVINVIFDGTVRITKGLLPNIIMQDDGRIINIASTAGIIGVPGQSNYSTAKSAVLMFTKTLAKEIARLGVTVNAIAPGYISTDMLSKYDDATIKQFKKSIPMHRFGKPEEVANVAYFLASHLSSFITGQVLIVDGGML